MDWSAFYGLLTLLAIGVAMTMGRAPPLMCGLLLLTDWFLTGQAVTWLGFDRAPALIAPIDATIAICILAVAVRGKCVVGYQIFGIYLIGGAWHLASYFNGQVGSYTYYAVLNILYAAAVLIVIGAGMHHAFIGRARQRRGVLRPLAARH